MLTPEPRETQPQFAIRFHETMMDSIPETGARDRAMMDAWRNARGTDPLAQKAALKFGRDHEYRPDCAAEFTEHMTKDRDGNPVIYDRNALVAILNRNNARIEDTGDFSPITAGHTPEKGDLAKGAKMPEVLGYAGPYRLGMIGDNEPRWAIIADEWHDKADIEKLRKLRRRSPEVWLEDRMEDRFFDPIAALGAETPRLDMGMTWYTRSTDGRQVEKYSATFPGAMNTFVPGEKYESDQPSDDINPEKAKQILSDGEVNGQPLTDDQRKMFQAAAHKYQSESGEISMISTEDVQQIIEGLMETEPMQWVISQMEQNAPKSVTGEEPNPVVPAETPPAEPAAEVPPEAPPAESPPAAEAPPAKPPAAPAAQTPPDEEDKFKRYEADDEDQDMMCKYMSGDCSEEDYMSYMAGKRSKYEADESEEEMQEVETYSRDDVRKLKTNYARMETELKETVSRLHKIESDKRNAERYAKLQQHRHQFCFDLDAEVARCSADKMTDAQFEDHLDVIVENYQRIPVSSMGLYLPNDVLEIPGKEEDAEKTEKYARDARKLCLAERAKGVDISYEEALDRVRKESA